MKLVFEDESLATLNQLLENTSARRPEEVVENALSLYKYVVEELRKQGNDADLGIINSEGNLLIRIGVPGRLRELMVRTA